MSMITRAVRPVLNGAVLIAFTASLAAIAAAPPPPAPVAPPPPPAKPAPKHKPYQAGAPTDATLAYGYRTSILTGKPGCQRFATDADNAFIDDKSNDATKVALLNKIGADASAAGCLAP